MSKQRTHPRLPATVSGPRPQDFPLGSLESRAAVRARLKGRDITTVTIMTGLPSPFKGPPATEPPDTVEYYVAPDNSIVRLICREHEQGKFTAFITQTWAYGAEYQGDNKVSGFEDLKKSCKPLPVGSLLGLLRNF
jgi:hypothetical protein